MDSRENKTSSLRAWCNECSEVDGNELSDWSQQDRQQSHEWSKEPDGVEGNGSKGTTPLQSNADTTQVGADLVVKVETTIKALLGVAPDAELK